MAPMDAIWLVLMKTQPLLATSWIPAHPPLSHSVGMLLVLATPVKNHLKWRGNLASYSPNSWWIDIELWKISCKHLFPFLSYNASNN